MMRNTLRPFSIAAALMALLPLASAFAQEKVEPVLPPSPRLAALGGLHAAAALGFDAILENPAGFANPEAELSIARLTTNLSGPLFDIAAVATSGGDIMAGLPTMLDADGRLYLSLDMAGPVAFGYVGKGLGFSLYNRTAVTIDAVSLLMAEMSVAEELLLTGGYAHRFELGGGHTLDAGIMAKGFARTGVAASGTIEDLMNALFDPTALDTTLPFRTVTGLGIDLGLRWTTPIGLAVGLVGRDAYSPALITEYSSFADYRSGPAAAKTSGPTAALVPADISLGLLYRLPFRFLQTLGADVVFMADYRDFLDLLSVIPRNPILNLSLGLETVLMDILSIRLGVTDALPAAGFGVDLSAFSFSLAMYGRELGMEPGSRPVYNLLVSLDFSY